jgi:dephospho-CoA kinase
VLLVGLTGGIASGKSSVSAMLAERGAEIVDADLIARQVVMPGEPAWQKILDHFGRGVLTEDGQVDRKKLADLVFADQAKLTLLNEITHPDIFARVAERLEHNRDREVVVVLDAALLIETGLADRVDVVVVVDAGDEEEQVRRLTAKGFDERDARARMAAQLPAEARLARADLVIRNDGTFEELTARVDEVWDELQRRLRERHGPSPIIRLP